MKLFDLQTEVSISEYRKKTFAFFALCIVILSIYSNTFNASWHFDDIPNIVENKSLHLTKISWTTIKGTLFAAPYQSDRTIYRPLVCLSLAVNYYFGKDNVLGYHIVNITVHILTAIFLFLFISRTLNLPLLKERYRTNSYFISLLSTFLWAINPIQTQAVTFIVQRMASMAGMFYIMSMFFYLRGRTANQKRTRVGFLLLCGLSTIFAFGSKENTVMIPVSLLLYDFFLIQGISRETAKKNLTVLLAAAFLISCLGIIYISSSEATLSSYVDLYVKRPFTLWERLMTEPRVIFFYIGLILYPMSSRLSLEHDMPVSSSLIAPTTTILSIILIVGIVLGAIFISKRRPLISFCVLFFFLNHVIESSILPLEIVFEHRNYIPSMFLFVPIGIGLYHAISYFSYKRSMQLIIALSIVLAIIGEGHATFMRNFSWKTEESIWIDVIEKYPHSFRAHHNLGKYYADQDQEEKAIEEYKKALGFELLHDTTDKNVTLANLGTIYLLNEDYETAQGYFLRAAEFDPCSQGAHNNLAAVLAFTTNDYQEVFNELNKAIACNPESAPALGNMGIMLIKMERWDEGVVKLRKTLEIDPDNIASLERLGYAYMKKGLWGKASIYLKRAFTKDPKYIKVLLYLTEVYMRSGHEEKARNALSHFVQAIQFEDLGSSLDQLFGEKSLLEITPDMDLILPLLCELYEEKAISLRKNANFCSNTSEENVSVR